MTAGSLPSTPLGVLVAGYGVSNTEVEEAEMADDDLTAEQLAANPGEAAVAGAAVQAAQGEPDPAKRQGAAARAARKTAREQGVQLSDEDIDRLAKAISGMTAPLVVDEIDVRGGFDAPPEPVAAPAPATAGEAGEQIPPAQPHKKTFAERFRSR